LKLEKHYPEQIDNIESSSFKIKYEVEKNHLFESGGLCKKRPQVEKKHLFESGSLCKKKYKVEKIPRKVLSDKELSNLFPNEIREYEMDKYKISLGECCDCHILIYWDPTDDRPEATVYGCYNTGYKKKTIEIGWKTDMNTHVIFYDVVDFLKKNKYNKIFKKMDLCFIKKEKNKISIKCLM
jgi:hypothetical protein